MSDLNVHTPSSRKIKHHTVSVITIDDENESSEKKSAPGKQSVNAVLFMWLLSLLTC